MQTNTTHLKNICPCNTQKLDKNGNVAKEIHTDVFTKLNIVDSFYRRMSQNENIILRNKTFDDKNKKCWPRKALLVILPKPFDNKDMKEMWTSLLVKVIEVRL
jgi:hypothetical protein